MYLSSTPRAELWPRSPRGAVQFVAASAVVWAVVAALLFVLVPGLDTYPRLLVFSECVGLTMVACVLLLQRQRRLERLSAGIRWLLIGVIAIPTGYLLGHQIAFVLLGEPLRMVGYHDVSVGPLLFTVLAGGLGLRYFAVREHLAREAAVRAEAQRLAVEAFQAIDGAGLSRVDFFLERETGKLLLNEINTMPGFTSISMYPKMWEASGIGYSELIDRLIELAFERHREKSRNVTSFG